MNLYGFIPRSLLRSGSVVSLLESVIPLWSMSSTVAVSFCRDCYSTGESRRISDWTPDPFDVAQGRGEHSRTTIKTFGGDNLGESHPRAS